MIDSPAPIHIQKLIPLGRIRLTLHTYRESRRLFHHACNRVGIERDFAVQIVVLDGILIYVSNPKDVPSVGIIPTKVLLCASIPVVSIENHNSMFLNGNVLEYFEGCRIASLIS